MPVTNAQIRLEVFGESPINAVVVEVARKSLENPQVGNYVLGKIIAIEKSGE